MLRLIDRGAIAWMNWRRKREINRNPELKDFKVEKVLVYPNGMRLEAELNAVPWMANELARLLISHDAKNYVQMDMIPSMDVADQPVRITVQWAYGEPPSERVARLERELKNLKQEGGKING